MPRIPEVYPSAFCPLSYFSNIGSSALRLLPSSSCLLPSASCLLHSAVCLLLLLITLHAQGATATLSGTVTDQNNAVIPGVNIAVISIAQGLQRSATTNGDGA